MAEYILDIALLEPGDIFLSSVGELPSVGVRKVTKSDYSHAMLYVGGGSYIHSDLNGVHADNTQRLLVDSPTRITVLRLARSDRGDIVGEAIRYARRMVGTQYSKREAVGVVVEKLRRDLNRQFCSRLVAQAFSEAGVPLVADVNYCTPQEIYNSVESKLLVEVLGCVREASQSELEFAKSPSPLERQRDNTNQFLKEVRQISGSDIQIQEQVTQYVVNHPEHDDAISEALRRSGYLDFWRVDIERNPWRYDAETLLNMKLSADELAEVVQREILAATEAIKRYSFQKLQFDELNNKYPRRYLQLETDLYALLVKVHTRRLESAQVVLKGL
ncbi:YiiX/YebB-like N1pC/P60 family cysteine hydrolase [Pseudomonas capsici]|uniref:YiiX/YebB-like N1pC/P60 family cysteine hydrolase n=1 Tax=Pseudomonas capsici TaxID=2810614 RepID=UPI0021F22938|nr:YiiX/YebB-like N1pC/P60 family cysteine hydrolase [Pseudomonas capsici]MCV4272621.1 YiiX/YebB-like N1pC/P60 family cysteine hydrolase [Pseudomonas capsici]